MNKKKIAMHLDEWNSFNIMNAHYSFHDHILHSISRFLADFNKIFHVIPFFHKLKCVMHVSVHGNNVHLFS